MTKWSSKKRCQDLEPRLIVNPDYLELETIKQILEEILQPRPSDVGDMIQKRMEEMSWRIESWPVEGAMAKIVLPE